MSNLNGVLIIPTGIGCALGGDASYLSGVNLIASCCNKLLANPNACNASDINTMANNVLYTEGSTLDRFLEGFINLKETKTYNKILCVVNSPMRPDNINAANASIWTLGANIELLELNTLLTMTAFINKDGLADGIITGADELIAQVKNLNFDILCVHTYISCPEDISNAYWEGKLLVNPWGKVEQLLSKYVSERINKQTFHAPIDTYFNTLFNTKIVKLQQAAEIISNTYCHCIYTGAHRAPIIDLCKNPNTISNEDIDFMISPMCWDKPHDACLRAKIPVIIVKENTTCLKNIIFPENENIIFVENYLEAAGIIMCMNARINFTNIKL
jgi:Protein of unknown function (DUF3326)